MPRLSNPIAVTRARRGKSLERELKTRALLKTAQILARGQALPRLQGERHD